jgi:competence protein ComFC
LSHDTAPRRPSLTRRLFDEAVDIVFPQRCVACGRFGAALHAECLDDLPPAGPPRCIRCWRPGAGTWCDVCATGGSDAPAFHGLRTPFRFEGAVRRALLEAKFRGITAHLDLLGEAAAATVPRGWDVEAVTAVPLSRGRERRRGFNQAALLARTVAAGLDLPLRLDLVRRVRDAPPQAGLSAARRATNLAGAFQAQDVRGSTLLVVDDVTTTGATFSAVADALTAAGARRVYALAVARED